MLGLLNMEKVPLLSFMIISLVFVFAMEFAYLSSIKLNIIDITMYIIKLYVQIGHIL
jgi:uncharacterized membrane protein